MTQGSSTPEPTPTLASTPEPVAEVAVDLTTDKHEIDAGETVTYTIVITNTTGDVIGDLVLSSTLPPSTTFVPNPNSPVTFDPLTGEVLWDAGDVPADTILTATYQVQAESSATDTQLVAGVEATADNLSDTLKGWDVIDVGDPPTDTEWITPEGGLLKAAVKPIRISVPTSAIEEALFFQVNPSAQPLAPDIWDSFDLTAQTKNESLVTSFPMSLTLIADIGTGYWDYVKTEGGTPTFYWFNETNQVWEIVPSSMDWGSGLLIAHVNHFSTFGIGKGGVGSYGVQHLPGIIGTAPDQFSGNSTVVYPFRLPPAPGGMGFDLGLAYSSEGVNGLFVGANNQTEDYKRQAGVVGWGWSITGLGQITRELPSDANNHEQRYFLSFGSHNYESIPGANVSGPNGPIKIWHTKPESYLRIQSYSNSNQAGNDESRTLWRVWTQDGMRYTFGDTALGNPVNHPSVGYNMRWDNGNCTRVLRDVHLTEILDLNGNTIQINYNRATAPVTGCSDYVRSITPAEIKFVPVGKSATNENSVRIYFHYQTRTEDTLLDYDDPTVQALYHTQRLDQVYVQVRSGANLGDYQNAAIYDLTQDFVSFGNPGQAIMRLRKVNDWGTNSTQPSATQDQEWVFTYTQQILPGGGTSPNYNLMTQVDNGQGGRIDYAYELKSGIPIQQCSGSFVERTTSRFRVTTMSVFDGLGAVTRHHYAIPPNAAYAQGWRNDLDCLVDFEFGGYKTVTYSIDNGNAAPVQKVETTFYQTLNGYLEARKGLPQYVRYQNPTTNANLTEAYHEVGLTDLTPGTSNPHDKIYWIRPQTTTVTTFRSSPSLPDITQRTAYDYDTEPQGNQQFGNVTRIREYKVVGTNNTLLRTQEMTYDLRIDSTPYITQYYQVNRLDRQRLFDGAVCLSDTMVDYDSVGRLSSQQTALTSTTSNCGGSWATISQQYDVYGNPEVVTDASGKVTRTEYDTPQGIGSVTYPMLYAYPISTTNAAGHRTRYTWNGLLGQVETVTDANNQATQLRYDAWGRLRKLWRPGDSVNAPTQQFTYLAYQSPTAPFRVGMEQATNISGSAYESTYQLTFFDGLGREVQSRIPFIDNPNKDTVTRTVYHPLGGIAQAFAPIQVDATSVYSNSPYITSGFTIHTATEYDSLARVNKITGTDQTVTSHRYFNHSAGLLGYVVIDGNRHRTEYLNDVLGRVVRVNEMEGNCSNSSPGYECTPTFTDTWTITGTTYYTYNAANQLITVKDAANNITSLRYDYAGRKLWMNDRDMGEWRYEYDSSGNLKRQVDSRGQVICFYHDNLHRLVGKQYVAANGACPGTFTYTGSADQVQYKYDGAGQSNNPYAIGYRTEMVDSSGATQWWYDSRGRISKESKTILHNNTPYTFVTESTYDAMDRTRSITYPNLPAGGTPETITYQFTDAQQLLLRGITSNYGGGYVSGMVFNLYGQLTNMTYNSSPAVHQTQTYWALSEPNGAGRLRYTLVNGGDNPGTILEFGYSMEQGNTTPGYDRVGNVLSIWEKRFPRALDLDPETYFYQQQRFSYDDLNRLHSAEVTGGGAGTGIDNKEFYHYDKVGNLVARQDYASYTNYDYVTPTAAEICPSTASMTPKAHAVYRTTGPFLSKYCYDAAGNMVYRQNGTYTQTLGYDAENRLISITPTDLSLAATGFVYDGDGNRVKSIISGQTTLYVGAHTEYRISDQTMVSYYTAGNQRVALRERNAATTTVSYLVGDHLGSASVTLNEYGQIVADLRYTAWGEIRCCGTGVEDTPTRRHYTGQLNDVGTGLYFYNARYYDPQLSRFTQADSIVPNPTSPQHFNRFSYAYNSPVRYVDPSGHCGAEFQSSDFTPQQADAYNKACENLRSNLEELYGISITGTWYFWEMQILEFALAGMAEYVGGVDALSSILNAAVAEAGLPEGSKFTFARSNDCTQTFGAPIACYDASKATIILGDDVFSPDNATRRIRPHPSVRGRQGSAAMSILHEIGHVILQVEPSLLQRYMQVRQWDGPTSMDGRLDFGDAESSYPPDTAAHDYINSMALYILGGMPADTPYQIQRSQVIYMQHYLRTAYNQ